MSSSSSEPNITVKLNYNLDQHVPRNFFMHIHNIPTDVQVRIEYDGNEVVTSRTDGYIRVGFWVDENESIGLTIRRGETVIASTQYLIHQGNVFESITWQPKPYLEQVVVGVFG
jgi:hypothetical protein